MSDGEVTQTLNREIRLAWESEETTPARPSTHLEWFRRVCLDVLGRIPTLAEVREFDQDRSRDKRQRWIDRLLTDSRFQSDYARNWTTIWSNLLIGRTGGNDQDSLISREGMRTYLGGRFVDNKPYDVLVRELITATGTTSPGSSQFNGATNFLASKLDDRAIQATARTAQLFLGTQIQCTQCHDHPFNAWKQRKFWELNAFYRQAVVLRRFESGTMMIREVELTDQDFGGEGNNPEEAETYFERRDGVLQVAYPAFLDGAPLSDRSGFVEDVHRRNELARLVLESPLLEQAVVNRYWQHFLGRGFTHPVDDLGEHQSVSHPKLLNQLADTFRKAEFDLKRLIRWIVLSDPYQLSSRQNPRGRTEDLSTGSAPQFSRFYLRPMSPEQLFDSLQVVTLEDPSRLDQSSLEPLRIQWLAQFSSAVENDEGSERTAFNGTIPQHLEMFNGKLVHAAIAADGDNLLSRILRKPLSPERKLEEIYLAALTRRPSGRERRLALDLLQSRRQVPVASSTGSEDSSDVVTVPLAGAFQDLFWALLNSNEFILNH